MLWLIQYKKGERKRLQEKRRKTNEKKGKVSGKDMKGRKNVRLSIKRKKRKERERKN